MCVLQGCVLQLEGACCASSRTEVIISEGTGVAKNPLHDLRWRTTLLNGRL